MPKSRFTTSSILISIAAHSIVAAALWWTFQRSESLLLTETGNAEISGMSWEVEPAKPVQPTAPQTAPAPAPVQAPQTAEKPDESADTSIKTSAAPAPSTTSSSAASPAITAQNGGKGPEATEIQKYLLKVRAHLSDAIQGSAISATESSSLVLKISISKNGDVGRQEIEKSSGSVETDMKVLAAFQSILPLPPFPETWNQDGRSPEAITVRLPIEIHAH